MEKEPNYHDTTTGARFRPNLTGLAVTAGTVLAVNPENFFINFFELINSSCLHSYPEWEHNTIGQMQYISFRIHAPEKSCEIQLSTLSQRLP